VPENLPFFSKLNFSISKVIQVQMIESAETTKHNFAFMVDNPNVLFAALTTLPKRYPFSIISVWRQS